MQRRLLDLQALDLQLDQVGHKRGALPELAALQELAKQKAATDRDLVTADTEVSDLQRDQKKADSDVEQVKTRRTRDQERLDSGRVGSPKELESLQHEIASLDRRIAALEDAELEVMERLETAEARQAGLRAKAEEFAGRQAELESSRDTAVKDLDEQQAGLIERRAAVAAELPADLVATYAKLRERMGGIGAGELVGKRCMGCRMELNPADLSRIAATDPNTVLRCEECGRILVRTDNSAL
ncbi:MAG TPA: C4-type zinc ribbon domain-containing protein [Kribbellaceae bacterium]